AVGNESGLPPLARNLSGTVAAGARSHRARNCSAVAPFSAAQIADSNGVSPSSAAPKSRTAKGLARPMVLAPSTKSAGHPAWSNANTSSGFIDKILALVAYKLDSVNQILFALFAWLCLPGHTIAPGSGAIELPWPGPAPHP